MPRNVLIVCRSEMILASLTKLLAGRGHVVTGVGTPDHARKVVETWPLHALVLAARGDDADVALVRLARQRGIPTLLVALSVGAPAELWVDGKLVLGVSNTGLASAVDALVGGPFDGGPPRAA